MGMKTVFENARLVDGRGNRIESGWLLVEEGKISALGPSDGMRPDLDDAVRVDLSGKTILPGLIDCHVHLSLDGSADPMERLGQEPDARTALRMAANGRATLGSGFTAVRDLGSKNHIDVQVRDAFHSGVAEGPRMLCAGQMICITGGHGWKTGCEADGPDGVRTAVRKQIRADVDVVKFMATGGVLTRGGRPGIPQLTLEELRAGIEEAHRAMRKTSAHSQGKEGSKNAVLAGIDSIEHGVALDDEIIALMLAKGVYLVPTLSAPANIMAMGAAAGIPDEYVEKNKRVYDEHLESLARARKAGVKIAMGTDAGTPFNRHGNNAGELVLMVKHGFTEMEAIQSATATAAELLGLQDRIGSLLPGRMADLLVVDGNPLANIALLTDADKIASIYKGGKKVR